MGTTIIAIVYWPLIAAVTLLRWIYWRRLGSTKGGIFIFTAVIIFGVTISVIAHASAIGLFDLYILFIAFGLFLLILIVLGSKSKTRVTGVLKVLAFIFLSFSGLAVVWIGGKFLIGDFLMPRHQIDGVIDRQDESRGRRLRFYHVYIDGKRYSTTADVYETIQPNMRIRAEVGAGSDNIFKVELISDAR